MSRAGARLAAGRGTERRNAPGPRPAVAFSLIGVVLAAVGARSVWIHTALPGEQPRDVDDITAPWPEFELVDRDGRPLALSVECFDLTVSPRSLWRSHTPWHIASALADVLAERSAAEWLAAMMPPEFRDGPRPGWLEAREPVLLALDGAGVERARRWLATGEVTPDDERPDVALAGFQLVPLLGREPGLWTLAWEPALALSLEERTRQLGPGAATRPERWTRRLLEGLLAVAGGEARALSLLSPEAREALAALRGMELRGALHDALWAELMPSRFRVVERRIDAGRAHRLAQLFAAEFVSPYQAELHPRLERRHPTRPGGLPAAPSAAHTVEAPDDAFALLGHWGVLDPATARTAARRAREDRPHLLPWEEGGDPLEEYVAELERRTRPWSGLELRAQLELEDGPWARVLEERARSYSRRVRNVARDRRPAWRERGRLPDYFEGAVDAAEVPRLHATLDAALQEDLHTELGRALERHRAALVMGIVVEVESGDVLAVDHRSPYPYSGFAPLRHVFTPGSTLKAPVMAIALDHGYVRPETPFPTYAGRVFHVRDGNRPGRPIREAEGAPTAAEISAALGLAHSCNAVLVQVGLRVPAPILRETLVELGYGERPGAGMGPEAAGYLTPLDARHPGGWSKRFTHASVSFGHEIGVTLWQHAEALATIARGGVRRPLRLLTSIEQGERAFDLPIDPGVRVLGEEACRDLRAMLYQGAAIGTGDKVAEPSMHPDLAWIGTKTGTTEKVPTELCLHVELDALARHASARTRMSGAERESLKFRRMHGGRGDTCYTSSMCAVGRRPDGREVLVLVVVDDPTGPKKYGAEVAGPTAVAVLRRALDLPRAFGEASARAGAADALVGASFSHSERPWAEEAAPWSTRAAGEPAEGAESR